MAEPGRKNKINVRFLMCGPRFAFEKHAPGWTKLSAVSYAKKSLPVDNVRIFEAGWGFSKTRRNARSLDEVVNSVIARVWPDRSRIRAFAKHKGLHIMLDCYVEYEEWSPLINLTPETIKMLAELDCSIGLEVLKLPKERFRVGDWVTVVTIPSDMKDSAKIGTSEVFERARGKTFRIEGFDRYGHIELNVTKKDTIWIEPEFVVAADEPELKERQD